MVHTKWIGCWWKQVSGGLARSPSSLRKRPWRPQPSMTWRYNSVVIKGVLSLWHKVDWCVASGWEATLSPKAEAELSVATTSKEKVSLRHPQEWLEPLWRHFTRIWRWESAYWWRFQLELKKKKTIKKRQQSCTQGHRSHEGEEKLVQTSFSPS